jgi:hypothetical protein
MSVCSSRGVKMTLCPVARARSTTSRASERAQTVYHSFKVARASTAVALFSLAGCATHAGDSTSSHGSKQRPVADAIAPTPSSKS